MPIYEFGCADCGLEFELIQSFSDESTPACPNCDGRHVTRRMGRPAIHFKGSGWYITDSKKSSSDRNGSNGSSAPATDKNGDAESSAKTDTTVKDGDKTDSTAKSSEKKAESVKATSAAPE